MQALADVSFAIRAGTVHALVGENGAGKSTLVKIITGVVQQDDGELLIDGEPRVDRRRANGPQARDRGDVPGTDGVPRPQRRRERVRGPPSAQSVARRSTGAPCRRRRCAFSAISGSTSDPDTPVRGLGVADRQLLEIAKALSTNARLLIMDEPTAALSPNEVDNLFATVRKLRDRGVAVVYISHRLEEVGALADMVTILRDGRHIETRPASELPQGEIIRLMVGRSLDALFPKEEAEIGDVVLKATGLTRRGIFADISFELQRGEIVGLAGFVGAGRTEVARSIFGVDPLDDGELEIEGRSFRPRSPRAALRRGLAYLPEDRLHQGLVQPMSVSDNVSMAVLPELTRRRIPPAAAANGRSRSASWSSCASRPRPRRRSCGASRAATSRRSCSASGSRQSRES